MKLFWGLIETHEHTFDSNKWKSTVFDVSIHYRGSWETPVPSGEVEYLRNTCLTCGDVVERKLEHGG